MKLNSSSRILIACAAALLIGGAIWLGPKATRYFKARHDVQAILIGLNTYQREHGSYPVGTAAELCGLLRGENFQGQNPRRLDYIEAMPQEMNAVGSFLDPWGTPYHIVTIPQPLVYSCGPNRVDEQGRGDDIAAR